MAAVLQPTVKPANPFNADNAASVLRKAMKGLGTDEAAIIDILCHHSNQQRQLIEQQYKTAFGRDLREDLKSEIGGNFENVIIALLEPPSKFDASELYKSIKGAGTDESTLIEILCSRSNAQLKEIKEWYKKEYDSDLEADIGGDTSGHFKKLLVSQLTAFQDESGQVDRAMVSKDAQDLHEAGENRWGTDESVFNHVLCARNPAQLRATFDIYKAVSGKDIEDTISSETSGSLQEGYLAIVKLVRNMPAYFAERLHSSMAGAGTDDSNLIRLVVSRSEVDLGLIKKEYQKIYGDSLAAAISSDVSGDYRKALLALVGK